MRALKQVSDLPAGAPLLSDDLLEFHASRLVLLLSVCGKKGKIEGLTKLAKLDFFVRYPEFFDRASAYEQSQRRSITRSVESSMLRFHYGPWDHRYYQILPYLEGCGLIIVRKKSAKTFEFILTALGEDVARQLSEAPTFSELREQMSRVAEVFGSKKGTYLKELIYKLFDAEVAQKAFGEVIE
ncbi:hypothetical protein [Deinococcus sp. 12RED42]|uniref:hypothetical protein n=1 Tax=Deinococcus sp. 12RED42 TaxID=2745872 RepID=UPI001E5280FA|nr:hypothetical protein [Deinococcus sp. 12RED42]MCD0166387.1 hypothetical protein [Deinococcus sp. 12RED42]